jgi:small-conductance mechanosensitive channel
VFWLLICVFLVAAFDIFGLPGVTGAIEKVVAYIPKVLVATVLVVVGLLLASFLRGVIATSADRLGISYAQQLASGCYYILAMMTFIAAFEQLEITFELLNYAILIAFGAIALALGLSFGLGGRDVMSGILCGYYLRQRFQAGDRVSVGGYEGTVRDVGPVATIIETEDKGMVERHSVPNNVMLNDAVR